MICSFCLRVAACQKCLSLRYILNIARALSGQGAVVLSFCVGDMSFQLSVGQCLEKTT